MSRFIRLGLLTACASLTLGAATRTAAAQSLTLAHAVEQTIAHNPELQTFTYRLRAQSARAEVAALRPPFEARAEVQDAFGTGRASGFDTAETTFALSQVVELGRQARAPRATRRPRDGGPDRGGARRRRARRARRSHAALHPRGGGSGASRRSRRARRRSPRTTSTPPTARVAAARAPDVELRRARIALARAQVEQEHAEHELLTSRRKLAAMWGDSGATFETRRRRPVRAAAERRLSRRSWRGSTAIPTSRASLPRNGCATRSCASRKRTRARTSPYAPACGASHDTNDEALVFGVNAAAVRRRRARAASIAEAAALREQTDAEREAHRVRAEAQLFELFQELRHAITEAEVLRTSRAARDGSGARGDALRLRARPLQLSRMGRRAARARRRAARADRRVRQRSSVSHRDRTPDGRTAAGRQPRHRHEQAHPLLFLALLLVGCVRQRARSRRRRARRRKPRKRRAARTAAGCSTTATSRSSSRSSKPACRPSFTPGRPTAAQPVAPRGRRR